MRTTVRRPANHALHALLSAVTCGVWLPVWAVCAVVGRRETVTVHRPGPPDRYLSHDGRYRWNSATGMWEVNR